MKQKKILLIDFCNYEDYPIGGYLTFAKNMIRTFADDLALVGITTNKEIPVGNWTKKTFNGRRLDFFALAHYNKEITKNVIPDRLAVFALLHYYKAKILQKQFSNVFIQRPEILIASKGFGFKNTCFRFAGLENPLENSKYRHGNKVSKVFDKFFFSSFDNVRVIFATGDNESIEKMKIRSAGKLADKPIIPFPTRIDAEIFKPLDKQVCRQKLNISESCTVVTTTGRLAQYKGWKFLIDCFSEFEKVKPDSRLYFLGEGEDREEIGSYIKNKDLTDKIVLAGQKRPSEIAEYLNASDLYVMGSYREGWSTSLLEALAVGVPICTTDFGSAKEIVSQGVTGYVVEGHNSEKFVHTMQLALQVKADPQFLAQQRKRYSISELKQDILSHWTLV